jgi:hypothetical protein
MMVMMLIQAIKIIYGLLPFLSVGLDRRKRLNHYSIVVSESAGTTQWYPEMSRDDDPLEIEISPLSASSTVLSATAATAEASRPAVAGRTSSTGSIPISPLAKINHQKAEKNDKLCTLLDSVRGQQIY